LTFTGESWEVIDTNISTTADFFGDWAAGRDVNGDGLQDIVAPDSSDAGEVRTAIWLNMGNGSFYGGVHGFREITPAPPSFGNEYIQLFGLSGRTFDYQGDGLWDMLAGNPVASTNDSEWVQHDLYVVESTGRLFDANSYYGGARAFSLVNQYRSFWEHNFCEQGENDVKTMRMVDIDGDLIPDAIRGIHDSIQVFPQIGVANEFIVKVRDGMVGAQPSSPLWDTSWTHQIEYRPTTDPDVYSGLRNNTCDYPTRCVNPQRMVVSQAWSHNGENNTPRSYKYLYSDGRSDVHGRGWLGFGEVLITDQLTGAVTQNLYDNFTRDENFGSYPFLGMLLEQFSWVQDFDLKYRGSRVTNEYQLNDLAAYNGNQTFAPYLKRSTRTDYESDDLGTDAGDVVSWREMDATLDEFGNVHETRVVDGTSQVRTVTTTDSNDTALWLLGSP
jgi:hypothetical protein